MSQGVGDRPYPGSYVTHEALLKKLGPKDYDALMKGTLSWSDPRVVETLTWVKQLVDAGAFPAELHQPEARRVAHLLPHQPGRPDVPGGELVHRARLQPAGQGRPAGGLSARHHAVAGDERAAPATSASRWRSAAATSSTPRRRARSSASPSSTRSPTPEMGNRWLENVLVQTGIKTDASKISGPHADYFKQLAKAQRGRQVLLRHAGAGDVRQVQGSLHAGHQQRLAGRLDQRRRRRQADERGEVRRMPGASTGPWAPAVAEHARGAGDCARRGARSRLFLLPALTLYVAFTAYPVVKHASTTACTSCCRTRHEFVGLANFAELVQGRDLLARRAQHADLGLHLAAVRGVDRARCWRWRSTRRCRARASSASPGSRRC